MLQAHPVFSLPHYLYQPFPQGPLDLGTQCIHHYWGVMLLDVLSGLSKETYLHILTHACMQTCNFLHNHLYLYKGKHEFTLLSPAESFMPWLILHSSPYWFVTSQFNSERSGSYHLPLIYLIV